MASVGRKELCSAVLCYALLCALHSRRQVNGPSPTGHQGALANEFAGKSMFCSDLKQRQSRSAGVGEQETIPLDTVISLGGSERLRLTAMVGGRLKGDR